MKKWSAVEHTNIILCIIFFLDHKDNNSDRLGLTNNNNRFLNQILKCMILYECWFGIIYRKTQIKNSPRFLMVG
jgi:hypothetical protein